MWRDVTGVTALSTETVFYRLKKDPKVIRVILQKWLASLGAHHWQKKVLCGRRLIIFRPKMVASHRFIFTGNLGCLYLFSIVPRVLQVTLFKGLFTFVLYFPILLTRTPLEGRFPPPPLPNFLDSSTTVVDIEAKLRTFFGITLASSI